MVTVHVVLSVCKHRFESFDVGQILLSPLDKEETEAQRVK